MQEKNAPNEVLLQTRNLFQNSLISGTFILTITGFFSKLIGFYYRIFLSRRIGAEGLGIYQLIFPVFAICISICASGIQTAISKYGAECKSNAQAQSYLYLGLGMSLAISVFCMFLTGHHAPEICHYLYADSRCVPLLKIVSFALPLACVHSCINGYYYGQKKTAIPAISQILEQVVRFGGIYLIWNICLEEQKPFTVSAAIWGIVIGECASCLFCITVSHFERFSGNIRIMCKNLLSMTAPLTLNRILLSVFQSAEALLIPVKLRLFGYSNTDALAVYGILTGMVFSTIMFPAVLSNSLAVMLLPDISKASSLGRQDLIKRTIRRTIEYCMILGLICTLGFLFTGNWIGVHLFHNTLAGSYIQTLCWICPFLFLSSTLCSILHGLGRAGTTLLINLSGSLIRILFIWSGIPIIGLRAYLWGMLLSQIFTFLLALFFLRRQMHR